MALLLAGLAVAGLVRVVLLPTQGLRDDTDQFAGWVHALATGLPFGQLYRLDLTFPPTMAYVFGALAGTVPAFAMSPDASDLAVRVALKLPATLADLGLVLGVAWLLRDRPRRAIAAALAVAYVPATWYISAWWGQFESIYVLCGLVAAILVLADHPTPAAIALGLALMTKPQAMPFIVPFAAYAIGRYGWRRAAVTGAVVALTAAATWLPFLADGGPGRYLAWLADYQDGVFAVISVRAWNLWWLVQGAVAPGGGFVADGGALLGLLTPRLLGLVAAGLMELVVFLAVLRRPTRDGLMLGLAASVLVAFSLLTTMHERYSYGAVVFLLPAALRAAAVDRPLVAAWIALAAAATANVVAAIPPSIVPGSLIPVDGIAGIAGAVTLLAIAVAVVVRLRRPEEDAG